jgi:ribonuclease-3 family protein
VISFPLTPIEQNILARGRNANLSARKKNSGGDVSVFQESTAFEALIGYTYITNNNRLQEMLHWIKLELDRLDDME